MPLSVSPSIIDWGVLPFTDIYAHKETFLNIVAFWITEVLYFEVQAYGCLNGTQNLKVLGCEQATLNKDFSLLILLKLVAVELDALDVP